MDHQTLVAIAQRASLQVLNYHLVSAENGCGLPFLDQETKAKISDKIQLHLPLAEKSKLKPEAYLEIVCDAAFTTVAEKYHINKRWFCAAVQSMVSMTLVPSIYDNAPDPVPLTISYLKYAEGDNSKKGQEEGQEEEEEQGEKSEQQPASAPTGADAPKNSRLFWTDSEAREVIDRRIAGEPYPAIAARLGRTVASIHNKWRLLGKPNSPWKGYIAKKTIEVQGMLDKDDEQAEESDESHESEESEESEEDEEADEEADKEATKPPAPAANTGTVAKTTAATEPVRPWTDPDIRELVRHKIDGLSTQAIMEIMRRPNRSVHCMWLNLWTNTNSKWFNYIHKQVRAKRRREKQEKASQGDKWAGADVTGQPDTTLVLGKRKRAPRSAAQEKINQASEPDETAEGNNEATDGDNAA